MSKEKLAETLCRVCAKRTHCISRDKGCAQKDRSCFQESACSKCPYWFYCNNSEKDFLVDETCFMQVDEKDVPICFVAPVCDTCPVRYHCKNSELPDVQFEWNPCVSTKPSCFSKYHSYK